MTSGRHWNGMVQVELTGAEPEKTLYALNCAGVRMFRVSWSDVLTVRFLCTRRDYGRIEEFCSKRGETVRIGPDTGSFFLKKLIMRRPVLTAGFVFLLILTFWLPTRVLFFRVEGNEQIPSWKIIEEMEACGIRFGALRREVRSEKMKNALLEAMPELKWAGINTSGCTAVISVRERETQQDQKIATGVTGIVSAADGYIISSTVVKGTGLCEPGQVVRQGQLLISGYVDHGRLIHATGAEGEVFAQTNRNMDIVIPDQRSQRMDELSRSRRFSLIVGKKRINLWKDSRIWDTSCGRMYEEYYLTLPGGFRLPICLGVDTLVRWKTEASEWPAPEMEAALTDFARCAVLEQTIAGIIIRETHSFSRQDGVYGISSQFLCSEMIGRVITEEIGDTNGKTD